MTLVVDDGNLFSTLQLDLKKYDKIFLIIEEKEFGLVSSFCSSNAVKKTKYKLLILSTIKKGPNCDVVYRQITKEECNTLCKLYYMYEFSDKFQLFSKEEFCGGLLNFLELGLLNREEVFEALLH